MNTKRKIVSALLVLATSISCASPLKKTVTDDYNSAFTISRDFIKYDSYNKDMKINEKTSEKMYTELLRSLDINKMYFTKEDLSSFKLLKKGYATLENEKVLELGKLLVDKYLEKVKQMNEYAISKIKRYDFDFNTTEVFVFDREEADFANNQKELEKLWDNRVLNDVERLILNDTKKEDIIQILTKRYTSSMKNMLKMSEEEKISYVVNGYAETFDPHNKWFSYSEAKDFEISSSLSLVGMGAQIQQRGEGNVIAKLLDGGPAKRSGKFKVGDWFATIGEGEDGEMVDVSTYRLKDLVKLIRGEEGSVVRIGVRSDLSSPIRVIKIVREKINQEDERISTKTLKLNNKEVGYIKIPGFYSKAGTENGIDVSDDLINALDELKNVDSLVIDLRGNGGGSLSEVIKMVGFFIGPKKAVVQVKDERGSISIYRSRGEMISKKPLVVMVDRFSASASEIFSGAIKDYKRGVVVGNTTWGKGSVQTVKDLKFNFNGSKYDLGIFKYTINMFFRPSGSSTQIKGVEPDIKFLSSEYTNDLGEFKYKNALKWEKIAPAQKVRFKLRPGIEKITKLHEERIKTDEKWNFIKEQNKFFDHFTNMKEKTLNLDKRKEERELRKQKQKEFEKTADKLGIPKETLSTIDNGLSYNEEDLEENAKREEILKEYIDPMVYEAGYISLDIK